MRKIAFLRRASGFHGLRRALVAVSCLLAIGLVGCGSTDPGGNPRPARVPDGSAGIVGTVPISLASLHRWEAIAGRGVPPGQARQRKALSYLIEARWAVQEAEAEGIDQAAVRKLVASRVSAGGAHGNAAPPAERRFQAKVEIASEALRERHSSVGASPTSTQIERYYKGHRSSFMLPPVRQTVMVVNRSRKKVLRARAALRRGEGWAPVAKRWSTDSSAVTGGSYAVVPRIAPAPVVHAAFSAPSGRLVGPVRARPRAAPQHPVYYLFKVTGGSPRTIQPLKVVRAQVRSLLEERSGEGALAAYSRSFERRWRARTLCAPGYLVPQCRNYRHTGPRR